jgi:hypothetical protein
LHEQKIDAITLAERYLNLELKAFCACLIDWLIILAKLKIGSGHLNHQGLIGQSEAMALQELIAKVNLKHLFAFFDKLINLHKFILEGVNLNKQLAFEDLLLDWQGLCSC